MKLPRVLALIPVHAPYIIDTVRAYATIGEITDTMRDVFGVFQEPVVI